VSRRKKRNGHRKVQIPFFGKMAEVAAEYLSGAFSVYVEGRLNTEERESKERDRGRAKRSSDLS